MTEQRCADLDYLSSLGWHIEKTKDYKFVLHHARMPGPLKLNGRELGDFALRNRSRDEAVARLEARQK